MNKEKAKDRRERQAKELEAAYNNGGDYGKVLDEIRASGDTFQGTFLVKAEGLYYDGNGNGMWLRVADVLPPPIRADLGWNMTLAYVKVQYAG